MSKVTWKSGTFIYPLPAVMVSCGTMEESNIITVAWTGIINTDPAMCYISVRPTRHSYEMIKKTGEFVINLTTKDLAYATDWCGVKQPQTVGGDDIEDESSSGFVGLNLHRRTSGKVPRTARKPAFRRGRQGFPVGEGGSEVPLELSQTVTRSELPEGVVSHKGVERPAVRGRVNARIDYGEARFAEKGDCPQK